MFGTDDPKLNGLLVSFYARCYIVAEALTNAADTLDQITQRERELQAKTDRAYECLLTDLFTPYSSREGEQNEAPDKFACDRRHSNSEDGPLWYVIDTTTESVVAGGYLNFEDAAGHRDYLNNPERFCPGCLADIDGNDPHHPECPIGDNFAVKTDDQGKVVAIFAPRSTRPEDRPDA